MLTVHGSSGFDFGFRVSGICLFCVQLEVQIFFHFSGQCVASEEILMCSLLLHSSILLI